MKTVKEELRDAIDLNLSQRELCRICGNALAEIERLETILITSAQRIEDILQACYCEL